MKNTKLHFFAMLLILLMSIMTIATSVTIPPHQDRLNYEIRGGYLYIEINPVRDPGDYIFPDGSVWLFFTFPNTTDWQIFTNSYLDRKYTIKIHRFNIWRCTTEEIIMQDPVFDVFVENNSVILKLDKNLIIHDTFVINRVSFRNIGGDWSEMYK